MCLVDEKVKKNKHKESVFYCCFLLLGLITPIMKDLKFWLKIFPWLTKKKKDFSFNFCKMKVFSLVADKLKERSKSMQSILSFLFAIN